MNKTIIFIVVVAVIGIIYWIKKYIETHDPLDIFVGVFVVLCLFGLYKFIRYAKKESK